MYLLLALAQCLPLVGNQLSSLGDSNALHVAAGVSSLKEGNIGGLCTLDISIIVESGSVSRHTFLGASKFLAQLGTSNVGNSNLLWSVRLEPLVKLCLPSRSLLVGEVVVMLI